MNEKIQRFLEAVQLSPDEIAVKTGSIHDAVLRESRHIDAPDFRTIHPNDLALLFEQYDQRFLEEQCRKALADAPLKFRLSKRMTSAGGKTSRYTPRSGKGRPRYEIAVSTTLLFQTFHDLERQIVVCGIPCHDRLQALQRVFEHELIHLVEMLAWDESNCSAARFQSLANRLFGHTHHRHELITPKERAFKKYGLRPGSRVRFQAEGKEYVGIVNRVTKRATVLVEDQRGRPYSDGKRYVGFYVPLEMLGLVE